MRFFKKALSICLMLWILTIQMGFSMTIAQCTITGTKSLSLGKDLYCCGTKVQAETNNLPPKFKNTDCCDYSFLKAKMEVDQLAPSAPLDFLVFCSLNSPKPFFVEVIFPQTVVEGKYHPPFFEFQKTNVRLAKLQQFLI